MGRINKYMYMTKDEKNNKLISLENVYKSKDKVKFKCCCGNIKLIRASSVKHGYTKSCGCLQREIAKRVNTIHGFSRTKLYQTWKNICRRCYNKDDKDYKYYGSRGIIVCDEWKNNFKVFYYWSIKNGWKEGLEIDRKDNDGNYEPNNCRWILHKYNNRNKRNNRIIFAFNEQKCLIEWAEDKRCVVDYKCLHLRIKRGWNIEKAITQTKREYV